MSCVGKVDATQKVVPTFVAFHIQWAWADDNCDALQVLGDKAVHPTFEALGYEYSLTIDYEKASPDTSETLAKPRQ